MPSRKSILRRLRRASSPPSPPSPPPASAIAIAEAIARFERAAEFRRKYPPPPPGTLKEGDICPCGCGGVMTNVDGTLTAMAIDVVCPCGCGRLLTEDEIDDEEDLPSEGEVQFIFRVA